MLEKPTADTDGSAEPSMARSDSIKGGNLFENHARLSYTPCRSASTKNSRAKDMLPPCRAHFLAAGREMPKIVPLSHLCMMHNLSRSTTSAHRDVCDELLYYDALHDPCRTLIYRGQGCVTSYNALGLPMLEARQTRSSRRTQSRNPTLHR